MKIFALIPARGESKRLPRKNARPLGGRPLVTWSIDAALGLPHLCDLIVSTDDQEIAEIAVRQGATVPWLRPRYLASDDASSVDVALHALDWCEKQHGPLDGFLLLQPTSPFRTRESIAAAISRFVESGGRPLVGVSRAKAHPMWCFRSDGKSMTPFLENGGVNCRSQDLEAAYVINGALYLIKPTDLRARRSFYGDDMLPFFMNSFGDAIDIDTEEDWLLAEMICEIQRQRSSSADRR